MRFKFHYKKRSIFSIIFLNLTLENSNKDGISKINSKFCSKFKFYFLIYFLNFFKKWKTNYLNIFSDIHFIDFGVSEALPVLSLLFIERKRDLKSGIHSKERDELFQQFINLLGNENSFHSLHTNRNWNFNFKIIFVWKSHNQNSILRMDCSQKWFHVFAAHFIGL